MDIVYSDLDQVDAPSDVLKVNADAVQQSVQNIFSTTPGQRFFNPDFGVDLDQILFELADEVTALNIEAIVYGAVAQWDNRVILNTKTSSVVADPENNRFVVSLYYTIVGLGAQQFSYTGYVIK